MTSVVSPGATFKQRQPALAAWTRRRQNRRPLLHARSLRDGKCYNHVSKVIEPNGHIEIAFKGPFKKQSLDAPDDAIEVHARYFDPAFGKAMSASANDRYKLNAISAGG
jgi:hypothetical protein